MPGLSRRVAVVGVGALVLSFVAWRGAGPSWRAAYPHLPGRAQALPYRLRAELAPDRGTPVPIPTSAAVGIGDARADPMATTTLRDRATPTRGPSAATPAPPTGPGTTGGVPAPATAERVVAQRGTGGGALAGGLPPSAALGSSEHEYQTWNNCGPATVSMALGHLGAAPGQAAAARFLKPDPDDKNVGPHELARYARSEGFGAVVRIDGTPDVVRSFLALGLPVIVETWFVPDPGDEMGHYRVLVGYDDPAGHFVADDSYNGPGIQLEYADFDRDWRVFNRTYVVVYPPEREGDVQAVLGTRADDRAMFLSAVARAEEELSRAPDAFGWFNMGASLLGLGDAAGAAAAFDRARESGLPWRMLWYQFEPFEAYAAEGRWDDVAALAQANLRNAPNLEESHYWLGRAHEAGGSVDSARAAYTRALELNPHFAAAREALDGV